MKIDGQSPNQPMFGNDPAGSAPAQPGRLGRWTGVPGEPGPSRLGPGDEPTAGTGATARVAQRQPLWGEEQGVEDTAPQDPETLHAWLSASPDHINRYAEDLLMDTLLEDFYRQSHSH